MLKQFHCWVKKDLQSYQKVLHTFVIYLWRDLLTLWTTSQGEVFKQLNIDSLPGQSSFQEAFYIQVAHLYIALGIRRQLFTPKLHLSKGFYIGIHLDTWFHETIGYHCSLCLMLSRLQFYHILRNNLGKVCRFSWILFFFKWGWIGFLITWVIKIMIL